MYHGSISQITIGETTYNLKDASTNLQTTLPSTYMLQDIIFNDYWPSNKALNEDDNTYSGVNSTEMKVNLLSDTWTTIRQNSVIFTNWTGFVLGLAQVHINGLTDKKLALRLFYSKTPESADLEYDLGKLNNNANINRGMGLVQRPKTHSGVYASLNSLMYIPTTSNNESYTFYLKGQHSDDSTRLADAKMFLLFFQQGGHYFSNGQLTCVDNPHKEDF